MTATSTTAVNQTTTSTKSSSSSSSVVGVNSTVVGYYFCDESIPYRTTVPGRRVTLGQFKQLINKKGNFRYFFKTACSDFDDGVVHEEVTDDDQIVPMWENKILCRVKLTK
ncbi:hypothetical protein HELRODRAFT_74267 [Helobdella robusta]|uniref:DIX domain-containing protein n=1 Tax=Helobdella robusta TaxID=6412 RepID=T1G1P1_HELRO|nr:hypothetical protein HELRODRAFT_74267 [Helobdella robusta]ESO08900.1 hypothetical protein HELRODRAFT_74267 [Helobdella robusta]